MLRYKIKTRPGLVALYNIWPGKEAGLFLQPRSPQGADKHTIQQQEQRNNTRNRKVISVLRPRLCRDTLFTTVWLPQRSLSSQSLGKYW